MNMKLVIIIVIGILILALIKKNVDNTKNRKERTDNDIESIEMEKLFFDRISNGSTGLRIASIYNQYDIMFIKSLFQSEQIPYYFEFENTAKIRTGLPIENYNNSILNILEEDYEDAILVLQEYKKRKSEYCNSKTDRIRNIAEAVIFGWAINNPRENTMVLYEKNENRNT